MDKINDTIMEQISIRDQVANIVRRKVLKNELTPGQKLSERFMSDMLNISTTPVKEAFRMLESEGVLTTVPRKGSYVSEMSKKNIKEITVIRSSLEGTAAFFAASQVNEDDIKTMKEALRMARQCIGERDIDNLSKYNTVFHNTIRTAAKNKYLLNLLKNLKSIDDSLRSVSLYKSTEECLRDHEDHLRILEAITNKNAEQAEKYMVQHVRRVAERTL